jgi:hypothetical protein
LKAILRFATFPSHVMPAAAEIKTPAQYIAALPADRRVTIKTLDAAIRKAAPRLKPFVAYKGTILGYGPYHYKYASGLEGDAPIVGLSSRKAYVSLYIGGTRQGKTIAEAAAKRLGNVSVGKVCIRFKKLEDLNLPVALELVRDASALIDKQGGDFSL